MDGLGLQPAPASSRSPLSARAFGPEVLLGELIGRGGMSRVYRGWLRANGLEVAVKILRDDLSDTPDAVQRFVRERDLLAAVAGPHVVRVHDLVVHGEEVGIVMDLVAGGHLRKAVSFPCPPADAAELAAQIADGLAAVHATGVIHRDLKPENVLVDRDEAGDVLLRLTDFGISRLVDTGTLTQTTVTGTPGYLSPEVAAGGKVTAAADIYALGVILYELCSGRGPFLADNALVLILAATRLEAPRPGGMPEPLWELISAMLAKNPAARPGAAEIGDALRELGPGLVGVPVCTPAPPTQTVDLAAELAASSAASPATSPGAGTGAPSTAPPSAPLYGPQPPDPPYGPQSPATGSIGGPPPRSRRESRQLAGFVPVDRAAPDEGAGWRRPRVLGALGAAAATLAVVGTIVATSLSGDDSAVVQLGEPTTSSAPTAVGSSPVPSTSRPPATSVRPVNGPTVTTLPPTSAASGGSTSGPPSPTLSPGAPSLGRTPGTPEDLHSSDKKVELTVGGISPGSGTLASVSIAYDAEVKPVPVTDPKATSLTVVVDGLSNGRPYTFTAKVCSSTKLCTTSAPFTFTPYGAPEVQQPVLSVGGLEVKVKAQQVIRHSHPGQTKCTVSVSPSDGTPQERSVDPEGESFTFTGKASTSYTATETCSTDGISDGSATSTAVTTSAPPPSPTPSPPSSPPAAARLV